MNKRFLVSLSVIGVVAAIAIGGTIAYFNDIETSAGNTFTAGTLNLKVGDEDPTSWSYYAEDIKPGDEDKEFVTIQNTGTTDGYLHITFANLVNDEMGCTEPEGDVDLTCDNPGANQGELAKNLDILIYIDENSDEDFDLGGDTLVYQGKARGILQGDLFNYSLPTGTLKKDEFVLERKLDSSVGNEIQTDSVQFDIVFELTQNKKEDIVGDWHFDENSGGTAYDNSGYGNNGTINGATWADGKYNPALSFDGVDDYVQVSHSSSLNIGGSEITLEAWIKANALPPAGQRWQILGKADAYALQLSDGGNGKARVWLGPLTGYIETNPVISTGSWYHLVGVYDGNSVKIYINGELKKEVAKTGNQATSTNNLIIGARIPGGYFNGIIDEARIYNRALNTGEILERYNAGN